LVTSPRGRFSADFIINIAGCSSRQGQEEGAITNLIEYPAVSLNTCRWRLQVTASHTNAQIDRMVEIAIAARQRSLTHLAFLREHLSQRSYGGVEMAEPVPS